MFYKRIFNPLASHIFQISGKDWHGLFGKTISEMISAAQSQGTLRQLRHAAYEEDVRSDERLNHLTKSDISPE